MRERGERGERREKTVNLNEKLRGFQLNEC